MKTAEDKITPRYTAAMAFVALCILGACPPKPIPPQPPIHDGDATCADACARAREMECEFAKPTPNGATCEDVCQNIQDKGLFSLDLDCRVAARTCKQAEACEQ
jgi:hypothetical protein